MSRRAIIRVRDVMNTDFRTIDRAATISDALREMREHHTTVLVVDRRDDDDEYGMLLVSDIAREVLARDRSPDRVNVYEVMRKPVVSVHPDMDIRYCSALFVEQQLVRAPVLEGKRIIGTISPNRLVLEGLARLDELDRG